MPKTYFNQAVSSLILKFPPLREDLKKLRDLKKRTLKLFRWVLLGDVKKEIREYHFFLNGILVKTLILAESLAIELDRQNPYTANMALRSHYESLAAVHYFAKNPDKRKQLTFGEKYSNDKKEISIKSIHIQDMLMDLSKNAPKEWNVMQDYDEMSNIIHPNKKSHQANIKSKGEQILEISSYCKLDEGEVQNYLKAQNNLITLILNGVEDIDEFFVKTLNITKNDSK